MQAEAKALDSVETHTAGSVIAIPLHKFSNELPVVRFGLHDVTVLDKGDSWLALLGIDVNTASGSYLIYIKPNKKNTPAYTKTFFIQPSKTQFLAESEDALIAFDTEDFNTLKYKNTAEPRFPFILPTQTQWQNTFGHTINSKKAPRKKRDFIHTYGQSLTQVVAPADAIISKIESINQGGSNETLSLGRYRIFLDHGRDLYCILSGLGNITIEVGDSIKKGAILGFIAPQKAHEKSGETLYPLQWQCTLNKQFILPSLLTKLSP